LLESGGGDDQFGRNGRSVVELRLRSGA
jgi:hypothetical protein